METLHTHLILMISCNNSTHNLEILDLSIILKEERKPRKIQTSLALGIYFM